MRTRAIVAIAIVLTSLSLLNLTSKPVYAHEHRPVTIAGKDTEWTVGWNVEPSFVDQLNKITLSALDNSSGTCGSISECPVYGLEALAVEVETGPSSEVLDLNTRSGRKGEYAADLIPTVSGPYTFRFFGTVNGTSINQSFTCGQTGPGSEAGSMFDCVEPMSDVQFPVGTPSLRDIVSRLDQALLVASVVGGAGLAIGAAGVLVGIVAYRRKPRTQT